MGVKNPSTTTIHIVHRQSIVIFSLNIFLKIFIITTKWIIGLHTSKEFTDEIFNLTGNPVPVPSKGIWSGAHQIHHPCFGKRIF
jgi:hypothetical protein